MSSKPLMKANLNQPSMVKGKKSKAHPVKKNKKAAKKKKGKGHVSPRANNIRSTSDQRS